MIDFSALAAHWSKAIAAQAPVAEEEIFKAKLSRIGVKAPFGTPPAHEQLAKAIAKAQVINGGSGNFMGEPLNDHGINAKVVKAELVAGNNMPYPKANYLVDKGFVG